MGVADILCYQTHGEHCSALLYSTLVCAIRDFAISIMFYRYVLFPSPTFVLLLHPAIVQMVVSGGQDGTVRLWRYTCSTSVHDAASAQLVAVWHLGQPVTTITAYTRHRTPAFLVGTYQV